MRFDLTRQQVAAVVAMMSAYEDDEQLTLDTLEGQTDLYEFVSALLDGIEQDEGVVNALAEQIDTRKSRQEAAKARVETRRDMIMALMDIAHLKKLALPEATITKRDGKAKLVIASDEAVPDDFQAVKRSPDKKKINEAFQDADELPNWLQRGDVQDVLTIRRK